MLDKQIEKKIEFKDLISRIEAYDYTPFEDLNTDERKFIIEHLVFVNNLDNSRKYLSMHRKRNGKGRKRVFGMIKIASIFLGICATAFLAKGFFAPNFSSDTLQSLSRLITDFVWIGGIILVVALNAIRLISTYDIIIQHKHTKTANEAMLERIKSNKVLLEKKLPIVEIIYEIFKTKNEQDNEYIRSVIMQELIKEMYSSLTKDFDENHVSLKRLLNEINISKLTINVSTIVAEKFSGGVKGRELLDNVLHNVDNRLYGLED